MYDGSVNHLHLTNISSFSKLSGSHGVEHGCLVECCALSDKFTDVSEVFIFFMIRSMTGILLRLRARSEEYFPHRGILCEFSGSHGDKSEGGRLLFYRTDDGDSKHT